MIMTYNRRKKKGKKGNENSSRQLMDLLMVYNRRKRKGKKNKMKIVASDRKNLKRWMEE